MASSGGARQERGHIRKRGNSYQVLVRAGIDPLTGRELRLTESTTDPDEAQRILNRLRAQVAEQRNPRTKATFSAALDAWLRVHEVEETTIEGYRGYIRRSIKPALGDVPVSKITVRQAIDTTSDDTQLVVVWTIGPCHRYGIARSTDSLSEGEAPSSSHGGPADRRAARRGRRS